MCEFIKHPNVQIGWSCCRCRIYNGFMREVCKQCGQPPHELTIPSDCATGRYFEEGGITQVEVLSPDYPEGWPDCAAQQNGERHTGRRDIHGQRQRRIHE